MQNLQALLKLLVHSQIDFVLVGGFAAVLHGCNQSTRDIDICIVYSPEQIQLLQNLLKPFHPQHRIGDQKTSFTDMDTSKKQDFHLVTDLGVLDVISHVEGIGDYYDILKRSEEIKIYGGKCHLISINDLIKSKKVLGRHRDLTIIMELEIIQAGKEK